LTSVEPQSTKRVSFLVPNEFVSAFFSIIHTALYTSHARVSFVSLTRISPPPFKPPSVAPVGQRQRPKRPTGFRLSLQRIPQRNPRFR
jgi:hypothetical protein